MSEINQIIETLGKEFQQFKSLNNERLEKLENGEKDSLLDAQIDKINASIGDLEKEKKRLDEIEARIGRMNMGGGTGEDKVTAQHKKLFDGWMRKGQNEADLKTAQFEAKLSTQIDEDGGYFVPTETEKTIDQIMRDESALRRLSRVQRVGSQTYERLINLGGATAGWVGEETAPTETSTPKMAKLEFPVKDLYAEPKITQKLLDDSEYNVDAWLVDEITQAFSEQESNAFISGNDPAKPRGLLAYPTVANSGYAWGKIGFIASGANGAFSASAAEDELIDLVHSLKSGYRKNATWMMNDLTFAEVRKIRNADGDLVWRPGLEPGAPSILLGKPVEVDDFMPDMATNSLSIAFGDFKRGYLITERQGVRLMRDAYTDKPNVKFYATRRVGGGVANFAAIKLMKFAA